MAWWEQVAGWGGIIVAAIVTGTFAVRTARRTPYETLKTLVDILDKSRSLPKDERHVIETAIRRELKRIDRLNAARIEGFGAYLRERIRQVPWDLVLASSAYVAVFGVLILIIALNR
ncbi:hypothetical protein AB0M22_32255 [Nocardia sp. NPDC051756]|uniref:hypothetical protein n=1 Tax=Nocardia sp. NPDC051756 TaxID=3154751 RepID=UPI00341E4C15